MDKMKGQVMGKKKTSIRCANCVYNTKSLANDSRIKNVSIEEIIDPAYRWDVDWTIRNAYLFLLTHSNVRVMRAVAGWLLEKAEELEKKDMKEK